MLCPQQQRRAQIRTTAKPLSSVSWMLTRTCLGLVLMLGVLVVKKEGVEAGSGAGLEAGAGDEEAVGVQGRTRGRVREAMCRGWGLWVWAGVRARARGWEAGHGVVVVEGSGRAQQGGSLQAQRRLAAWRRETRQPAQHQKQAVARVAVKRRRRSPGRRTLMWMAVSDCAVRVVEGYT